LALAEHAVSVHRNAWYLHTLAQIHYRAGHFEKAVHFAKESMETDPPWNAHVDNWLILALAHHRQGTSQEAKKWLDQVEQWLKKTVPTVGPPGSVTILGMHPHDGLACHVLWREARVVFAGSKGNGHARSK